MIDPKFRPVEITPLKKRRYYSSWSVSRWEVRGSGFGSCSCAGWSRIQALAVMQSVQMCNKMKTILVRPAKQEGAADTRGKYLSPPLCVHPLRGHTTYTSRLILLVE